MDGCRAARVARSRLATTRDAPCRIWCDNFRMDNASDSADEPRKERLEKLVRIESKVAEAAEAAATAAARAVDAAKAAEAASVSRAARKAKEAKTAKAAKEADTARTKAAASGQGRQGSQHRDRSRCAAAQHIGDVRSEVAPASRGASHRRRARPDPAAGGRGGSLRAGVCAVRPGACFGAFGRGVRTAYNGGSSRRTSPRRVRCEFTISERTMPSAPTIMRM